jgi:hypothetical protein
VGGQIATVEFNGLLLLGNHGVPRGTSEGPRAQTETLRSRRARRSAAYQATKSQYVPAGSGNTSRQESRRQEPRRPGQLRRSAARSLRPVPFATRCLGASFRSAVLAAVLGRRPGLQQPACARQSASSPLSSRPLHSALKLFRPHRSSRSQRPPRDGSRSSLRAVKPANEPAGLRCVGSAMRRVCDASGLRCVGSAMRRVCDATRSRPVGDHAPPSHSRDGGALA